MEQKGNHGGYQSEANGAKVFEKGPHADREFVGEEESRSCAA